MVIKKKAEKSLERKRNEIIGKGGRVHGDLYLKQNKHSIVLRIPVELLKKIDEMVDLKYGMTRTSLILQAIQEKFEKENLN